MGLLDNGATATTQMGQQIRACVSLDVVFLSHLSTEPGSGAQTDGCEGQTSVEQTTLTQRLCYLTTRVTRAAETQQTQTPIAATTADTVGETRHFGGFCWWCFQLT